MGGRTPNFVLVGLVMVTFLVGFFYMSCSSKTTELRQTIYDFEDRMRSLTSKNNENEKEINTIRTEKRALETGRLDIQRQLNKKESEFRELSTKLNEKTVEIQSLISDNKVLDEQLKEFKKMSETLASKKSVIEKLEQEYNEQKKSDADQLFRLKQEIETFKKHLNNSPSNQQESFQMVNQRYKPFISNNETTKNTSTFFQEPLNKLSNLTNQIKDKSASVISDLKEKIINVFDKGNNSGSNQNIPAPPLSNKTQPLAGIEPARSAPELDDEADIENQEEDNRKNRPKKHRSSNNIEYDDKQRFHKYNFRKTINRFPNAHLNEIDTDNNQQDIKPSRLSANHKNYRTVKYHRSPSDRLRRSRVISNDDNDDNQEKGVAKGNLL